MLTDADMHTPGTFEHPPVAAADPKPNVCPHGVDLDVWNCCLICPPPARKEQDRLSRERATPVDVPMGPPMPFSMSPGDRQEWEESLGCSAQAGHAGDAAASGPVPLADRKPEASAASSSDNASLAFLDAYAGATKFPERDGHEWIASYDDGCEWSPERQRYVSRHGGWRVVSGRHMVANGLSENVAKFLAAAKNYAAALSVGPAKGNDHG